VNKDFGGKEGNCCGLFKVISHLRIDSLWKMRINIFWLIDPLLSSDSVNSDRCSPHAVRRIKGGRMSWEGHVIQMENTLNTKVWSGNWKGKDLLKTLTLMEADN
jgi:hypothetical protein